MKKLLIIVLMLAIAIPAWATFFDLGRRGVSMGDGLSLGTGLQIMRKTTTTPAGPTVFVYKDTGGISYKDTAGITFKDY